MQSVNADLVFLQMPYSAAVGFQLIFRKPDYSFVKFTKDCGFVVGQCSCNRYRVGYMVAEQVDFDVQLVDERPYLHQSFDFRLFDICAVLHFLIKLGFREYGQRDDVDDSDLLRALKLSSLGLLNLNRDLNVKGFTYYRWKNLPPDDHNLPRKGDKVVFMYRKDNETLLYVMHCIADNDRDAECFVAEKEKLNAIDDSSYYVFTLTRGPVAISNDALSFLETEEIDTIIPETFLSDKASSRLRQLLDI